MKALNICLNTKQLIQKSKVVHGRIHSIFDRVCNIVTEEDLLIPIIAACVPNLPRSISLNLPKGNSMYDLGFCKGMKVILYEDKVIVGENNYIIDLLEAEEWDPRPILNFKMLEEKFMLENIDIFKSTLIKSGNFNGIARLGLLLNKFVSFKIDDKSKEHLNVYSAYILPEISQLIEDIVYENIEGIKNDARKTIGFGPGLTPSTDDFICGIMISMIYATAYYGLDINKIYEINKSINDEVGNRTTKVSSEMLSFASRGEVSENIRRLLIGLFAEKGKDKLVKNVLSVIANGETSGSDLVAGIYIGCTLIIYKHSRKIIEH